MSYKTLDGTEDQGAKIVAPGEKNREALLTGRVCGECKYFSLREGQRLIAAQNFLGTLVHDHKWKVHHLGSPPETLGDCGAHRSGSSGEDVMLTGPLHVACDQWRKK